LRLADIELDVQSEAAFGLLGAAAQAARPMLRDELARYAVIDLKPFTAQAKQQLSAAVAEFAKQDPSVRVDAGITDLRLVGIAFDAKALRIIAEADGKLNIAVSSLAL
jgi:C-terminal processing protease CtpA/Prc